MPIWANITHMGVLSTWDSQLFLAVKLELRVRC
jgi:hypothetical protein